jgi:hypothetical protein
MHQTLRTTLLLSICLGIISGCRPSDRKIGETEADYIEYNVVYLENMAGDIPTKMLPDVMEAYYSNRYIKTSIKGFFGQFALIQIADLRKSSVTTMINFFGNKVFYTGDKGEIPVGIRELNNPGMHITSDTLRICGMLSKKAVVETIDDRFDIYFIEEIDIKSPNITTPYYFIDHVLSDFRVQLSVLKMQLIMRHHEKTTVNHTVFEIPEEYKQVTKETMEAIINSLFTKE